MVAAARCFELMMQRTLQRKVFGKYMWEHGSCQEMIADSVADLSAARLLTLSCAAALDDVGPRQARDQIATIKVAVPAMTYRVVDRAVQVFGGYGYINEYPVEKIMRDAKLIQIYEGTSQIQRLVIAKEIFSTDLSSPNKFH